VVLPLSLFHVENHIFLSHGVQVAGATWQAAMRIMAGVGDLVRRIGGQIFERSSDVVRGLHRAHGDEELGFLGLASKPRSTVC
jgi:hypothetical protein